MNKRRIKRRLLSRLKSAATWERGAKIQRGGGESSEQEKESEDGLTPSLSLVSTGR